MQKGQNKKCLDEWRNEEWILHSQKKKIKEGLKGHSISLLFIGYKANTYSLLATLIKALYGECWMYILEGREQKAAAMLQFQDEPEGMHCSMVIGGHLDLIHRG